MKKPMDRRTKQPTKKEQAEIFKHEIAREMQKWYMQGIIYGADLQCSTILKVYKKKYDETPKSKRTKAFLEEIIANIFQYCENGTSNNLESVLNEIKGATREEHHKNISVKDD